MEMFKSRLYTAFDRIAYVSSSSDLGSKRSSSTSTSESPSPPSSALSDFLSFLALSSSSLGVLSSFGGTTVPEKISTEEKKSQTVESL